MPVTAKDRYAGFIRLFQHRDHRRVFLQRLDIGHGDQRSETAGEAFLLLKAEVLVAEDQHLMLLEEPAQKTREGRILCFLPDRYAPDLGTDTAAHRFDSDASRHSGSSFLRGAKAAVISSNQGR